MLLLRHLSAGGFTPVRPWEPFARGEGTGGGIAVRRGGGDDSDNNHSGNGKKKEKSQSFL